MEQDYNQYQTHAQDMNVEQFTNETALKIRLDTAPLIYQLQLFLEGKNEQLANQNGNLVTILKDKGSPMANEVGIQRILSLIQTIINAQMVQGNLKEDRYDWFMMRFRRDLNKHVFVNMYKYDVCQEEYGFIVDMICNAVELFVSRTINNKERDSYANFMSHFENATAGQSQKKDSIWNKLQFGR